MQRSATRVRLALATVVVACGSVLLGVPTVATAADGAGKDGAGTYVALGDSYSSGLGTRQYRDDSSCRRSDLSYPALVAAERGASLDLQACAGATTSTVLSSQVQALDAGTDLVTLSVGGNDAGFTSVLTTCAEPRSDARCRTAVDAAQAIVRDELPGRLDSVYAAIGERAPNASVAVAGYPRLFMGEDCNALTWFSPDEQTWLNETADLLSDVTSRRAAAAGFSYVDVVPAFVGHAVCDDPAWVNGLSSPVDESYHPNQAGQAAYARLVGPAL